MHKALKSLQKALNKNSLMTVANFKELWKLYLLLHLLSKPTTTTFASHHHLRQSPENHHCQPKNHHQKKRNHCRQPKNHCWQPKITTTCHYFFPATKRPLTPTTNIITKITIFKYESPELNYQIHHIQNCICPRIRPPTPFISSDHQHRTKNHQI